MSAEDIGPHFGCPECGCPTFDTSQSVTQYCNEDVTCTFTSDSEDEYPDYEIDDYGSTDCYDSEAGELHDEKTCADCGHEYTEPKFFPAGTPLERIADNSDLSEEELEPLTWILEKFPHAKSITVKQRPHATVIEATPKTKTHGNHHKYTWTIQLCCTCGNEMSTTHARTKQVYQPSRPMQKMFDKRQLPILLRATVCPNCQ